MLTCVEPCRTELVERQEGVRIEHRPDANSVELDDKAFTSLGSVLRAEPPINDVSDFRV